MKEIRLGPQGRAERSAPRNPRMRCATSELRTGTVSKKLFSDNTQKMLLQRGDETRTPRTFSRTSPASWNLCYRDLERERGGDFPHLAAVCPLRGRHGGHGFRPAGPVRRSGDGLDRLRVVQADRSHGYDWDFAPIPRLEGPALGRVRRPKRRPDPAKPNLATGPTRVCGARPQTQTSPAPLADASGARVLSRSYSTPTITSDALTDGVGLLSRRKLECVRAASLVIEAVITVPPLISISTWAVVAPLWSGLDRAGEFGCAH